MKKNIALLIPTLGNGGAERVAANLSQTLSEQYNVYMIVYDGEVQDYAYGGSLIDLKSTPASNPVQKILRLADRVIKLRRIKKENQIGATISFMEGPNIINILARMNDRVIISIRNFKSLSKGSPYIGLQKWLMKRLYNYADVVVPVSEMIKLDLAENFGVAPKKMITVHNSYDIASIQARGNESLDQQDEELFKNPVLINVGRLTSQKAQWNLIRAFAQVRKTEKNAQLVILGNGSLQAYLEELISELELEDSVHLKGFQKNPFKYLTRATGYVFPSMFEGFPNALCEAMACGLPVIAADCKSGPREILAPSTSLSEQCNGLSIEEYGILIPVCNGVHYRGKDPLTEEECILAEAMSRVLSDEATNNQLREKALARVSVFSVESIQKQWVQIIEEQ